MKKLSQIFLWDPRAGILEGLGTIWHAQAAQRVSRLSKRGQSDMEYPCPGVQVGSDFGTFFGFQLEAPQKLIADTQKHGVL